MSSFGVCMISTYYYPYIGGAEKQIERLSKWLVQNDVNVLVITQALPDCPRYEIQDGIEIWRVPVFKGKALRALSFIIMACLVLIRQRRKFDIIHSHQIFSPTTIGWFISVLLRKPLIVNLHGGGPYGDLTKLLRRPRTGKFRLNQIARQASTIISITQEISEELRKAGIDESKVIQLPNSVDSDEFCPVSDEEKVALRKALNLPLDVPIAVYVGRLVDGKGLEDLIEAWGRLSLEAYLIVIGTGDLETALRQQAEQLSLNTVQFVGFKTNISEYLQACDVWTLPSYSEGVPISLLEAMSCAMPIVTTPVGGIPEIIKHEVNGRLIPPGKVDLLAEALSQTLKLDQSTHQLGLGARQTILERYSINISAQSYLSLYNRFLKT